ncbi:hypothetical protein ABH944_008406 [Caballeronia udeis]|uniref:Uncharacterized protein n=1 Tax=Caballeronia udeis TaxID=1232866 RepID=A0ABW8MX97_9BURK
MVTVQGWSAAQVSALDDGDVCVRYCDALRRRIVAAPRAVKAADDFVCPPEHLAGWNAFQEKVENGQDINPYLSKRHASLFNLDGLLGEWGVHHFHLGIGADTKNPAYMARTGSLLYALVTDTAFCAINVFSHESFEDSSVLESIHRNWPEMIRRYRANGVTGATWTSDQRRALRGKNGNVLTTVSDGTVYLPITGGVMASGVNAEAVRFADYWQMRVRELQTALEDKLDDLLLTLGQNGYAGEPEIEATLQFSEAGVHAFFPKYGVRAILNVTDSPLGDSRLGSRMS